MLEKKTLVGYTLMTIAGYMSMMAIVGYCWLSNYDHIWQLLALLERRRYLATRI